MINLRYSLTELYGLAFKFIIITLSISPAFMTSQEDGRNYLLIGSMCFGPLLWLSSVNQLYTIDKKILVFVFLLFSVSFIFNFSSIRWSSLMFTCMFLFYFIAAIHCLTRGRIGLKDICEICKWIIYAYCIVLLIQQVCVLLGLPVFNANNYTASQPWKLNALSAEPSHTSRYVGVLMFSFLILQNRIYGKKIPFVTSFINNKKLWMSFLWVMLTTMSGTAMIVVALVFSIYITRRNATVFILFAIVIFIIGIGSDVPALRRAVTFLSSVVTGNSSSMIEADHSASVRVVPWILCIQRINPFSLRSWVGEGIGSTSMWMSDYMPGVVKGWTGGGVANMMVEYGIIVGLFYLILSFKCCYNPRYKFCTVGLWIMSVLLLGINMQISWLCILMLFITNQKDVKYENKSVLQFA